MDFSVDVTEQEILKQVEKYPNQRVCITGGEPLLQDVEPLTHLLSYDNGYTLHLETNGTIAQPLAHIHWVTVSPKNENSRKILRPHEVKLLVPNEDILDEIYFWSDANMGADHKFFQPINYRSRLNRKNVTRCLSLLEDHPGWRLSIQLHKVIGVR